MATNTTSSAKTHVSLRLPTSILESIDAHAEKEHISRTEAFVYYLQTGLEISDAQANEPSKDEVLLQSIQDDLTVIKALLQTQPGAATTPHPYTVPAVEIPEEPAQAEAVASEFTTSDEVEEPKETQEVEEDEGVAVSLESEPEPDLAEEAEALLKRIIPPPMPPRAKSLLQPLIRCMRSAKKKALLRSNLLMSSMKQASSPPLMQFPKKSPQKRSIRSILPKMKAISPRLTRPKAAKRSLSRSSKKLFPRLQKISHRSKKFGSTVLLPMQKRSKTLPSICA